MGLGVNVQVLVHLTDVPEGRLRASSSAKGAVGKSRVSRQVGRMAERGLVAREAGPQDGRGAYLAITPAGRRAIAEGRARTRRAGAASGCVGCALTSHGRPGLEFTPITRRLGCLRGVSTLTGFALAVEIGDWTRFSGASIGAFVGLTPSEHPPAAPAAWGRSPRPATVMPAGCWSKRPGTTARPTGPARRCTTGGRSPPLPRRRVAMRGTGGCTGSG